MNMSSAHTATNAMASSVNDAVLTRPNGQQKREINVARRVTGTPNENVETADQRGHEGDRGHYGYGPRSQGAEEED